MADEVQLAFEIVKHVTLPLLKFEADPVFVQFLEPIIQAEATGKGRAGADGTEMKPPEIAKVQDLVRKIPCQIIVNAVLGAELRKAYPGDTYVGKSFRLAKNNISGKRYKTFEILEVKMKQTDTAAKGK
jgi:hypothetical protein